MSETEWDSDSSLLELRSTEKWGGEQALREQGIFPDGEMIVLPTLYSRTATGAVQQWDIEICPSEGKYRTHYGQKGGTIVTTDWTFSEETNLGKANERTIPWQYPTKMCKKDYEGFEYFAIASSEIKFH